MTREEITTIYDALSDAANLIECTCDSGGCDGACTHALAVKGLEIVSREVGR